MNDDGFVKIYRKMLDWQWYKDIIVRGVFNDLILRANWKSGKFQTVEVSRGSIITSIKQISEDCGISFQQVRTALKKLQSTNDIEIQTTNKFTIITICNYNFYQDKKDDFKNVENSTSKITSTSTNKITHTSTSTATNKNKDISSNNSSACSIINRDSQHTKQHAKQQAQQHANQQAHQQTINKQTTNKITDNYLNSFKEIKKLRINTLLINSFNPRVANSVPKDSRESIKKSNPKIDFQELRDFYNRCARPESHLVGFTEFKALVSSGELPPLSRLYDDISQRYDEKNCSKQFVPSLTKYLREQRWQGDIQTMQPSASSHKNTQGFDYGKHVNTVNELMAEMFPECENKEKSEI